MPNKTADLTAHAHVEEWIAGLYHHFQERVKIWL